MLYFIYTAVDKTFDTDKKWNTIADKKLYAITDNVINTNKKQDNAAIKYSNAIV